MNVLLKATKLKSCNLNHIFQNNRLYGTICFQLEPLNSAEALE